MVPRGEGAVRRWPPTLSHPLGTLGTMTQPSPQHDLEALESEFQLLIDVDMDKLTPSEQRDRLDRITLLRHLIPTLRSHEQRLERLGRRNPWLAEGGSSSAADADRPVGETAPRA